MTHGKEEGCWKGEEGKGLEIDGNGMRRSENGRTVRGRWHFGKVLSIRENCAFKNKEW